MTFAARGSRPLVRFFDSPTLFPGPRAFSTAPSASLAGDASTRIHLDPWSKVASSASSSLPCSFVPFLLTLLSLLLARYILLRSLNQLTLDAQLRLHRLSDQLHLPEQLSRTGNLSLAPPTPSNQLQGMLTILSDITGIGAEKRTPYDPPQELPPGSLEGKVYLVTGGHGGIVRLC